MIPARVGVGKGGTSTITATRGFDEGREADYNGMVKYLNQGRACSRGRLTKR